MLKINLLGSKKKTGYIVTIFWNVINSNRGADYYYDYVN